MLPFQDINSGLWPNTTCSFAVLNFHISTLYSTTYSNNYVYNTYVLSKQLFFPNGDICTTQYSGPPEK